MEVKRNTESVNLLCYEDGDYKYVCTVCRHIFSLNIISTTVRLFSVPTTYRQHT